MQCATCNGTGICQPCRGSGRSGNSPFWRPENVFTLCSWCRGAKACRQCNGTGNISEPQFRPYIHVERSLLMPTSVTVAAFTGARWRFVTIPDHVLSGGEDEQLNWIAERVRAHFRENGGKLLLFGEITRYRWVKTPGVSVMLDTDGNVIEVRHDKFVAGGGSLRLRDSDRGTRR